MQLSNINLKDITALDFQWCKDIQFCNITIHFLSYISCEFSFMLKVEIVRLTKSEIKNQPHVFWSVLLYHKKKIYVGPADCIEEFTLQQSLILRSHSLHSTNKFKFCPVIVNLNPIQIQTQSDSDWSYIHFL